MDTDPTLKRAQRELEHQYHTTTSQNQRTTNQEEERAEGIRKRIANERKTNSNTGTKLYGDEEHDKCRQWKITNLVDIKEIEWNHNNENGMEKLGKIRWRVCEDQVTD